MREILLSISKSYSNEKGRRMWVKEVVVYVSKVV